MNEAKAIPMANGSGATPLVLFLHGSADMYGSDKVLLNLATALLSKGVLLPVVVLHEDGPLCAALAAAGVEVHVATVVKVQRRMLGPTLPWSLLRELSRAFTDLDRIAAGRAVRLVYSNTLAVLGGAFWARRHGLRHLWHVHEILNRPAAVRRGLPWLADRLSASVISNSQQTQDWLLRQAPRLADRAAVVFNGLPLPPQPDPLAAAKFRFGAGVPVGALLITVAGRLNHWKGQDLFIEALALMSRRGTLGSMHAAIVGDVFAGHEDLRAQLVAQADAAGLAQRVHFVPFVKDIWSVWRTTDIAVVPSIEPEPFGMVAIEAMACGVPVIAAAHGGLLDIIEHERSGLLFRPRDASALADAIERLSGCSELRRSLGASGEVRQAVMFSLETQVRRTQELCLAVMGQP